MLSGRPSCSGGGGGRRVEGARLLRQRVGGGLQRVERRLRLLRLDGGEEAGGCRLHHLVGGGRRERHLAGDQVEIRVDASAYKWAGSRMLVS